MAVSWGDGVEEQFPLSFDWPPAVDRSRMGPDPGFLVASMHTPDFRLRAERLRESCERLNLPHVLYEVPSVHRSISMKGSADLRLTKANFIHRVLELYGRPVLYVDADCLFRRTPDLIGEFAREEVEFALYNWLADPRNEAFYPVNVRVGGKVVERRYFDYSHRIGLQSDTQAVCSGCTQFYGTTRRARSLLAEWHRAIAAYPGTADDECITFVLNNRSAELRKLRLRWLPKEYARYAWWIFSEPVIDHPELPGLENSGFQRIPVVEGRKHFYAEQCDGVVERFPPNCVIDVKERLLYQMIGSTLFRIGPLDTPLWISDEARAPATLDVEAIVTEPME